MYVTFLVAQGLEKEGIRMKKKKELILGVILLVVFIIWTGLIQYVDVKPIGANNTDIGFSTLNSYFHQMTGVHMTLYKITD